MEDFIREYGEIMVLVLFGSMILRIFQMIWLYVGG